MSNDDPQPHVFNVAFAALRTMIPNNVKAVNLYQRVVGGPWQLETSFAFHTEYDTAQLALDRAQQGDFIRGVTFARGLFTDHPREWLVADAFETEN